MLTIYPEIERITEKGQSLKKLRQELSEKTGYNALLWEDAYFVDGCWEQDGHLYRNGKQVDNSGILNEDCYCLRYQNLYLEDEFHGILYFKANTPGRFTAVPFVD